MNEFQSYGYAYKEKKAQIKRNAHAHFNLDISLSLWSKLTGWSDVWWNTDTWVKTQLEAQGTPHTEQARLSLFLSSPVPAPIPKRDTKEAQAFENVDQYSPDS